MIGAETFFNPVNTPLGDSETVCWELPESSKPVDYSSMNFILQNNSEPEEADGEIAEICEKYFRLAYWAFPKRGFSPSSHFLHGRGHISSQVKVAKSLYVIEEIGKFQTFLMEGKTIDAVSVVMRGLAENNGEYFFSSFPAFIDMELADKMISKTDLKTTFINGIVTEITSADHNKISLMTVMAEQGESYYDLLGALIGIVADKKFSLLDSVGNIGTVDELREDVFNLYLDICRKLNIARTLSEAISNSFDIALQTAMFPVLIIFDHKVIFIHSLTWGFLKKWNLLSKNDVEQKEILINLMKIMELCESGTSRIFLDSSAEYFLKRGINKFNFIKGVAHLVRDIQLCKMMKKKLET